MELLSKWRHQPNKLNEPVLHLKIKTAFEEQKKMRLQISTHTHTQKK